MPRREKGREKPRKTLDRFSAKEYGKGRKGHDPYSKKKPRGRPRKIPLNWVTGRAYNYRLQLQQVWSKLEAPLLAAKTVEEITAAFESHGQPSASGLVPERAADILALLRHPKFPKRSEVRINFIADSLGGRPSLSLRTSRDICEKERARQRRKSRHRILRNEFYIECTCGYKGPARDNACRKCGAEIPVSLYGLRTGACSDSPLLTYET